MGKAIPRRSDVYILRMLLSRLRSPSEVNEYTVAFDQRALVLATTSGAALECTKAPRMHTLFVTGCGSRRFRDRQLMCGDGCDNDGLMDLRRHRQQLVRRRRARV